MNFTALVNSMEQKAYAMIDRAAEKTADYMYNEFKHAIDVFYASYTPIKYQRHYNMDLPGTPYSRKYKGGKRFGGVKLDSSAIPAVYHDDPSYVFWQSTMQGWHGGVGIFSSPSPMQMLREALYAAANNPAAFLR